MTQIRVSCLSLDGYGAGPDQDIDHTLGIGGEAMHQWGPTPSGNTCVRD